MNLENNNSGGAQKLPKTWGVTLAIIMMGIVGFTTYSINLTQSYNVREPLLTGYNGWSITVGPVGGTSSKDRDEGDKECDVEKEVSPVTAKNGTEVTYKLKISCDEDRDVLIVTDTIGSSSRGYISGTNGGQVKYVNNSMDVDGLASKYVDGEIDESKGVILKNIEENETITIEYDAIINDENVDENEISKVNNTVKLSSGNKDSADFTIRGKNVTIDDGDSGLQNCSNSAADKFSDISKTHWANCYISQLVDLGVIDGYADGTFRPDYNITRAELTKIALLTNGYQPTTESEKWDPRFPDVEPNTWQAAYINTAHQLGIIHGYNDGTFRPDAPVTRAEAVKILLRSAGLGTESVDVVLYPDVPQSSWYYPYVAYATLNEIVDGFVDGRFGPNEYITRAEAAKIAANTKNVSRL